MVIMKISEYRQAFKPKLEIYARIYESNYGFRINKRKTEISHDSNPFSWDVSDEDDEITCRSARPASVPLHIYKHALFNQAYKQKVSPLKNMKEASPLSEKQEEPQAISKEELKIDIPQECDLNSADKSPKSVGTQTPRGKVLN